jgi:Holliday junction resolvase
MREKIKLTKRNIEHILTWADALSKNPEISWTKVDADLYFQLLQAIRKINKIRYENSKLK